MNIKKIAHRVLSSEYIKKIPEGVGIEFDVHAFNKEIVVAHEPFTTGISLPDFLKMAGNRFLAVNIKEEGIEEETIKIIKNISSSEFFLFDVNPPQIFRIGEKYSNNLAFRISQLESIDFKKCRQYASYLWIDTFDGSFWPTNKLLLEIKELKYNLCFVSPELHRPPIGDYKIFLDSLKRNNNILGPSDHICSKFY